MSELNGWHLMAAVLAGVLALAVFSALLRWAGEHDRDPARATLTAQMMRRKSHAMHGVRDAMIRGRLDRVEAGAARIERSATGIEGFLRTEVYQRHGEDFYSALEDLQAAASQRDQDATKDAMLRLEKSCIECHNLINQR